MRGFLLDLTYSLRLLRKSPGFASLAILCLGLGIGVNTAVFGMLDYLFFRAMPVDHPDRLVVLGRASSQLLSWPDYRDLRARSQSIATLAASNPTESSLDFDGETHAAAAEAVSADYPQVIGARPFMGRWFTRDDAQEAVIGYRAWQRWFHADPHVIGKRVRSETQWYTIAGVAPREFAGIYLPLNMDIWVPFGTWSRQYPELAVQLEDRTHPRVFVFGRLQPGISLSQARAVLNTVAAPPTSAIVVEHVRGVPNARSRSQSVPIAAVLLAVVASVLLIACVNVGNLLLARAAAREREVSLRLALGARRGRIVRQLLTESLLLAAGGGVLGMVLGVWTSRLLEVLLPTSAFGEALRLDLTPDASVLLCSGLLAAASTLIFGLAPAWRASRTDVISALKGDTHPSSRFGLRRLSLIAQVSLSLVLLLTAALFLRVLFSFQSADPGFAFNHRVYVTALASAPEFTPETSRQFYASTLDELRRLPGVTGTAITNLLPLTPVNPDCVSEPGRDPIPAATSTVSPGYFSALGIALIAGRDFDSADKPGGAAVAIVNQALASRLWPGQSPLGKRLLFGCCDRQSLQGVGLARDARLQSLGQPAGPHVFRAFAQDSGGIQNIIVATVPAGGAPLEMIRKTVTQRNTAARIYGVRPLAEWVDRSFWQVRWEASMLGVFGVLALILAAVGLYGVVACHVTGRTREIGIRLAVGATPTDVLLLVLRQGLQLTSIGLAIGLAAAVVLTRAMTRLLFEVTATDLTAYASVTALWLIVAAAACYFPARSAAKVDPTGALRYD